jgi:serine/threonine protein kinase
MSDLHSLEDNGHFFSTEPSTSRFDHEAFAIDEITKRLGDQVKCLANHELYDAQTNQYLECDLIVVDVTSTAIIELKHWTGRIEIVPSYWIVNESSYRVDPHKSNGYKCKVLSGFLQNQFPTLRKIWVESIVVLTNPEAEIINASNPITEKHNPTFGSIDDLFKYFRNRPKKLETRLTGPQTAMVLNKIKTFGLPRKARRETVSGYQTRENLTWTSNRLEVLATPLNTDFQTVKRLRIFLTDLKADRHTQETQRKQSLNSLKAIERIGDHPNVLKVWSVPDENGRVVECSDWSEEGTLATLIAARKNLSVDEANKIILGILQGLSAVHEQGVVHRDLSPENILMVKGSPKLMNFDLSYLPEDQRLTVIPESGLNKKTPYTAPELLFPGQFAEATDMFGVGVIWYELLTGKVPFKISNELSKTGGRLRSESIAALKEEKVSPKIIEIIDRLIQLDRLKRPQEVSEVLGMLSPGTNAVQQQERVSEVMKTNRHLEEGESYSVYEIVELIGEGQGAQVYKATQTVDRVVAIKLFNTEVDRERIYREREYLERVHSPFVVRCETINQWTDKRYFIVLGLIDGPSLRRFVDGENKPKLDTFYQVASKLFEAIIAMHMDQAHEEPLLHNDIKPENILLTSTNDPILIDFGSASIPHIGPYQGTNGYVAPDLLDGAQLSFTTSGDLFAVGVTLFEWFCSQKPFDSTPEIWSTPKSAIDFRSDCPVELDQWFKKAVSPLSGDRFSNATVMRDGLHEIFASKEIMPQPQEAIVQMPTLEISTLQSQPRLPNRFVAYLNTLHNLSAGNENALAESQALSPDFGSIHIPTRVTDVIYRELTSNSGGHVILTGHAGDGKSTIGLELYKRLIGQNMDKPLMMPLREHEQVSLDSGLTVHIVKDMSELGAQARLEALLNASQAIYSEDRWLIISNTGTLLSTIDNAAKNLSMDYLEVENILLRLLEAPDPKIFDGFGAKFTIINLARIDNVPVAISLLERLVDSSRWEICSNCSISSKCPIWMNALCLKESFEVSAKRVKAVYRLLSDFGKRLTMRQVSAHFAYSITGGLDCDQIKALACNNNFNNLDRYLFHNLFFGFCGSEPATFSSVLPAIEYLAPLELGSRPFPRLERSLYVEGESRVVKAPTSIKPFLDSIVDLIRTRFKDDQPLSGRLRQQVRRLVYLFCDVGDEIKAFPANFLGSEAVFLYEKWDQNPETLDLIEKQGLLDLVLHVLQEEFTGYSSGQKSLGHEIFITAKRSMSDLMQSVQVLYAKTPKSNFELILEKHSSKVGERSPVLILKERVSGAELTLDSPLLDFVILRSRGEIGRDINPAYFDRMNRFKSLLVEFHKLDNIELLTLRSSGALETIRLSVQGQNLQVI